MGFCVYQVDTSYDYLTFIGDTMASEEIKNQRNKYEVVEDIAYLTIIGKDGTETEVLFDADDLHKVKRRLWHTGHRSTGYYAISYERKDYQLPLAHLVMDATEEQLVGYLNHRPLDCRKSNLFIGDRAKVCQSGRNAKHPTGVAGVHKVVTGDQVIYMARMHVRIDGKPVRKFVGNYSTLDEAKSALEHQRAMK